jgi:NAD(P)-dependent dehydrogenase (short-subunit alcohol dehydrogenase family)
MNRFEDKVVVITGGGSGLGRLCAHNWGDEGGKIVVTDIVESRAEQVAAEVNDAGGTAIGLKADVTLEAEMEMAVHAAVDQYGKLDIMFANAGVAPEGFGTILLEDYTEEQWRATNKVVYDGVYFAGKHACRQMKVHGAGNIVVTVSAGAHNAYPPANHNH